MFRLICTTLLLALINFSFAQDSEVSIKEIRHQNGCRSCYGMLIISNGHKTDSISDGQWGDIPNYNIKQISGKRVLVLDNDYGFPGGNRIKFFRVLSLDKENFLDLIFEKKVELYKETHINENNYPVNYVYRNDPKIIVTDTLTFVSNVKIEYCPEREGENCFELLEFNETEYFNLGSMLSGTR